MSKNPEATAQAHRSIQDQVDHQHGAGEGRPLQVGGRRYPEPPFPQQHQAKPGRESALEPAPLYEAPYWKGSQKLEGKVALITGGDSGIGRAVAVLFAREGADIAIVYLNEHDDAAGTQEAVEREGRRCLLMSGDVTDKAFCNGAADHVLQHFGGIDILVNNAAFQMHVHDFADLNEEHFDRTIKTNLYGYYHMAHAVLPHLPYGGAIVNNGSVTGLMGNKDLVDYSMTKGGIHAFTRALATHLAPKGIRVNAVAPGPVWSPLNPADKDAPDVAHFGEKTVMKRPAQPEEIAPAFLFLACNQSSSYITGEILPVIGGYGGG